MLPLKALPFQKVYNAFDVNHNEKVTMGKMRNMFLLRWMKIMLEGDFSLLPK